MTNITQDLTAGMYLPEKALVVYKSVANDGIFIESFDMDESGRPINAHPLSEAEISELASSLKVREDAQNEFLHTRGLLPSNVLFVSSGKRGFSIWYTRRQKVQLFFKEDLNIPSGKAHVPALLWVANRGSLHIYALKENDRPNSTTKLYYAPFFNIHDDGEVCMGTVDVGIPEHCRLEDFIRLWQSYFFNSYFSHLLAGSMPVQQNIVQLWQRQMKEQTPFPTEVMKEHTQTIKKLIA